MELQRVCVLLLLAAMPWYLTGLQATLKLREGGVRAAAHCQH